MKNYKVSFIIGLLHFICISFVHAQIIATPDGYAASAGTTGGGNSEPIIVFTASEFKQAINNNNPAVVIVCGRLNVGGVSIGSNKTIVGANKSAGLYGGVVRLTGTNYIFQNLIIGPNTTNDAMELSGAKNVFIHKCEFYDGADGNLDIVRGSDYVTVSWCKFYYKDQENHKLSVLIGNGDNVTSDAGKLHVTMHHCWFAEGCQSRMPRVRYGHVHIYNNYYSCTGNNYCIGAGIDCYIRLENSCFDNIHSPWDTDNVDNSGLMGWDNLQFVSCEAPTFKSNTYPVFDLPYNFIPDPIDKVKTIVSAGAGNIFGENDEYSPRVTITSIEDSSKFMANSSINIEANAIDNNGIISKVDFYCDSLLYSDTDAPYSFKWDNVKTGTYNLWAMVRNNKGTIAISPEVKLFVGTGINITAPKNNTKINIPANITINVEAWDGDGVISGVEFFEGTNSLGYDSSAPFTFNWSDVPPGTYILTAKATDNENNVVVSEKISLIITGGPEGFEYCSSEADECVTDKLINIAYGANGNFKYLYNVTGKIDCSSSVFGDPLPGATKACYAQEAPTPYVSIVYPASGKTFTAPAKITFYAKAVDNDGTIDSIEFFQNNTFIAKVKTGTNAVTTFDWKNVYAGNYSITAKVADDEGNTFVSDAISIVVEGDSIGTLVNELNAENLSLYPNPVTGKLKIFYYNYSLNARINIYNYLGTIVKKEMLFGNEHLIDMNSIPNGVYFIELVSDRERIMKKIIKK